jgi:hypothetical protein
MALTRYGELRNQLMRETFPSVFAPVVVRDADSNYVPIPITERLVQCVWYDQRVLCERLHTATGQPVRVVFPGWWNQQAGPDFRHATVQIGDEPEQTGDVEVHLRSEDWFYHGHQYDPDYNNVILHVVLWEAGSGRAPKTQNGCTPQQLVLQHQLAAPIESVYDDVELDMYPHNVGSHVGSCVSLFKSFAPQTIMSLLDAAGDERFAIKARRYARWIHRTDPEQAFYEAWMEALGYKANKPAFRAIAKRLPLAELREHRGALAPLMFGIANFLPTGAVKGRDDASHRYVRRLWNAWWKFRPDFEDRILPADLWRFHGIRPANHPHRRLGAAVALLKKHQDIFGKVVGAVESGGDPAKLFALLRDDYWNHHFTLAGKTQRAATELIGAARAQEIVTNVVLPFVAAFAEGNGDDKLREKAKADYDALRQPAINSLVRLAARQLFGVNGWRKLLGTTRRQQGLIQVFLDFCVNDKSGCEKCQFPELARRWVATA